jgi:uncharacterized protein (DUF488 family)
MRRIVYTIGHSTHSKEYFLGLLELHRITAVCDVRSSPYSRLNPQFNREPLKAFLQTSGVAYLFLGQELGARSKDPACYEDGKLQYNRLAQTALFQQGIERIEDGSGEGFRVALMCAEKEPLECHRTILVARHLTELGIDVLHIHGNGSLESHAEAVSRLCGLVGIEENDLFRSAEELRADAYRLQEERIAYAPKPMPALGTAAG